MNLTQVTSMMRLQKRPQGEQDGQETVDALTVARRVFTLSAATGDPYLNQKPEQWAQRWLASRRFVLVEVAPHQLAVPYANRVDEEKVRRTIAASGMGKMEPIVVDVNKQKIGKTIGGYVPRVIVVDGKNRHRAQVQQGRDRVLAWVGELALRELQARAQNQKKFVMAACGGQQAAAMSKMESQAVLHAFGYTGPAIGPMNPIPRGAGGGIDRGGGAIRSTPVIRQDTGDGGSRPTGGGGMARSLRSSKKVKAGGPGSGRKPGDPEEISDSQKEALGTYMKNRGGRTTPEDEAQRRQSAWTALDAKKVEGAGAGGLGSGSGLNPARQGIYSQGARSSGSLRPKDASDRGNDPSDLVPNDDPSDLREWDPDISQVEAPGAANRSDGDPAYANSKSPSVQMPGAGIGRRMPPDSGATNSDMSKLKERRKGMLAGRKGGMEAGPIKVKKLWTKDKQELDAVAPPGREAQVKKLKKKLGTESAFKIAWAQYNK